MADFKIAKIRFTWKGNWASAAAYVKDDIVRYGAKTFVCMVTHTSSVNFYTDLNNATTRWNEMIDGYEWTTDWAATTFYQVNDLAKYGGIVYRCTTSHTSGSTLEAAIANWTVHVSTEDWLNTWTATTFYNVNDVVRWGAIVYRCNTAHTSATFASTIDPDTGLVIAATDYRGLEYDQANWTVIHSGTDWKGVYTVNTRYKLGDIVRYNSSIWYCTTGHRAPALIDETKFSLWMPGLTWEDEWSSTINYTRGDIVSYGGYVYRAITNNAAINPGVSPGDWQLVAEQYRDQGLWLSSTVYKLGDMVRWSGGTYVSILDSQGIEPPNATYWRVAIYTDRFTGVWSAFDEILTPYKYIVGDIVSFQSNTYICIERHTATLANRPDEDVQGIWWQPYVLGSPTNVLKILGDMKTYGVTEDGSSIGVTRREIGANAEILRTTVAGEADFAGFYKTPKVYYVGPNGTDSGRNPLDPLFGQNPDLTFASIRYACDYILDNEAARAPATIYVRSGIYYEMLPISVPANVAIVGDELRNPTVRPAATEVTKNMFLMRQATGLRNMTLEGLTGTLGAANTYLTKRPTAGAYVSLDPGNGPNDTNVWITTRSPYIQNVTTFGTGCVGVKVDGNLHNGGNKSITANDFTQVLSDGIGAWITNGARAELVSVFTYYNHIGYLAENNGKIRATNGNNSYGDYGAVAEGDNPVEVPKTALVNNRASQASVGFIFTNGSSLYRYEFNNAGSNYTTATSTIAGTGVNAATATWDEFRDRAVYQIRVAAPGDSSQPGGGGYVGNSGNGQAGSATQITLSATDANDSGVYVGMRIMITSGLGVGQIGYINAYNSTTKIASVYNEDTGLAGWGHIVPGTAIASSLDTTSAYSITPRVTLAAPAFTPTAGATPSAAAWVAMAYGNGKFVLISTGATTTAVSTDGIVWTNSTGLPSSTTWTDIAAGAISGTTYHIAVASGGTTAAYSTNGSTTWSSSTLSAAATWTAVAYGNSRFVAVSSGGTDTSISTNGTTWVAGGALPGSTTWSAITYGNGKFVAVAGNAGATTAAAYSTDGTTWVSATLPSANWTSVAYGNGRFVAVAQGGTVAAYSFDGITWVASTLPANSSWLEIRYGQGTFIAMQGYGGSTANGLATSTDGVTWTSRTLLNTQAWSAIAFGNPSNTPIWALATTGTTVAQSIPNFTQAKIRGIITAGRMSAIRIIEPGSGYTSTPAITITDPNNTGEVTTEIRRGNGVLATPSFTNRGTAYVTATTTITGDGYADNYQTGSYLYVKNLTLLPGPGANLNLASITTPTYSVVDIDNITGSAGNYSARIRIFPSLDVDESPQHEEAVEIREDYSQCRITGHDFLEIGTGTQTETAYPATDLTNLAPENQTMQAGGGRVFYTSTDQDGNFRVGELFQVEQATGVVSINADAFNLSGLSELRLGGVTLGGTGATIREFSTDPTFSANSNNIVPTQKAIKAYIASRIGGGGSDLDVNEIQAGSIKFTAPNQIGHIGGTIYTLDVRSNANFTRGVVGGALAMKYFTRAFIA